MRNPLAVRLYGTALLLGVVAVVLTTCPACTYNHITFEQDSVRFEQDSVRFADTVKSDPGQGGDSSDTGATGGGTTGGAGKLSPGGSNLIDGRYNFALLIQQGGETPTTPTTTASANVQSPGGSAATGGETGTATTENPAPANP